MNKLSLERHDGDGVNCVTGCDGGGTYESVGALVGVGVYARGLDWSGQPPPKHVEVVEGPS